MAYDKVVDSSVLDAGLKAIADAIRAKGGTSGNLEFPTAMAETIAGIQAGGGGGGASGIYMAQITPASDATGFIVNHNLGTTDILMAACFAESLGDIVPSFAGTASAFFGKSSIATRTGKSGHWGGNYYNHTNSYVDSSGLTSASYHSYVVDENSFSFANAGAATRKFYAGVTYTIIIMAASAFTDMGV